MPHTTLSPTPTTTPPALSLEERLAFTNTAMTLRLEEAAVAHEVNTAHIPTTPVDLNNLISLPLTPTLQPPAPSPTPVTALLQRAHQRILTNGWCAGTFQNEDGALCLFGAVRTEANHDLRLEMNAMAVLLDAIRNQFGDRFESVPSFNDSFRGTDGHVPVRMLGQAADLAGARGI
ncbi:hypothetical protein ACF08M_35105 [Streptomyces sp. NPDC015032]|uniref:DUF6197 family protein n=1 Tax=Streptomyces sp. NPDC015032 TaxID=3364937 RepID=UPI0036FA08C6